MDPNALIVAGIVVAAILVARRSFGRRRDSRQQPNQSPFRCARCSASSMHTARTLEAKRRGKTKFFC